MLKVYLLHCFLSFIKVITIIDIREDEFIFRRSRGYGPNKLSSILNWDRLLLSLNARSWIVGRLEYSRCHYSLRWCIVELQRGPGWGLLLKLCRKGLFSVHESWWHIYILHERLVWLDRQYLCRLLTYLLFRTVNFQPLNCALVWLDSYSERSRCRRKIFESIQVWYNFVIVGLRW